MRKRGISVSREGVTFHGRAAKVFNVIEKYTQTLSLLIIMHLIFKGAFSSATLVACLLVLWELKRQKG